MAYVPASPCSHRQSFFSCLSPGATCIQTSFFSVILYMPREKFTFRHEALTQKGRRLFAFSLSRSTHICICRASFFASCRAQNEHHFTSIFFICIFSGRGMCGKYLRRRQKSHAVKSLSPPTSFAKKGEGKIDH